TPAEDARLAVEHEERFARVHVEAVQRREARLAEPVARGRVAERAELPLRRGEHREREVEDATANAHGVGMRGRDDHALAGRQVPRGGEAALALDVDEARPGGGERAHALTPDGPVEHPEEPRGPLPARGALAARLAHVEGEQRPHDVLNRHALVEGDDAARSRIDRTARDERLVELPRGNDTPGWPAQDGGADRPARRGAAAEIVEQRPERRAEGDLDDPRAPDVTREAEELGPAATAEAREPGPALGDDGRHGAERLDVVDDGRLAPEPRLDGEGRARAGHRAIAFDRLEERGFLAQDEAAGAAA